MNDEEEFDILPGGEKVSRTKMHKFLDKVKPQGYFLTNKDVEELSQFNRLCMVLVRCGGGRFLCAAQDCEHFIGILEREGTDYLRDVSLPVGELEKYGIRD